MLSWAKQACPIPGTAHCPNNTTYNKGRGKAGVANVDPEGWQVIVTHLCGAVCGLARAGRGGGGESWSDHIGHAVQGEEGERGKKQVENINKDQD